MTLAAYKDKGVVDFITDSGATLTREIKDSLNYKKGGNKGFETVITRLQMQTCGEYGIGCLWRAMIYGAIDRICLFFNLGHSNMSVGMT